MGLYTRFYFRAKLAFDTPEAIRSVLRAQFDAYSDAPSNWNGSGDLNHPFFQAEGASMIPWATNMEDFPAPSYREYPDGSSILEFTCEFKNYGDEINLFLAWLTPYLGRRYGRRQRGRIQTWVGYSQSETSRARTEHFVPCKQHLHSTTKN